MRRVLPFVVCLSLTMPVARADGPASADRPPPPARAIPALNAPDSHAGGCVSCHIDMPEIGVDARLSTAMERWTESVGPELMAKVRGTLSTGATLKGRHPSATKSLEDIPAACIKCHSRSSKAAPPFSRMVHVIHLTGGDQNHFMTLFQGECTHCHKLDLETGEWSMPGGRQK